MGKFCDPKKSQSRKPMTMLKNAIRPLYVSIVEWVRTQDKEGACLAQDGIDQAEKESERATLEELHAILYSWSEGREDWEGQPNWEDRGDALERLNLTSHYDDLSYFLEIKRLWLYIVANVPKDE